MRENEKERELLKASRQNIINDQASLLWCYLGLKYYPKPYKITKKSMKESLFHEGQFRKNEKCKKKSKSQKGKGTSSQAVKFLIKR